MNKKYMALFFSFMSIFQWAQADFRNTLKEPVAHFVERTLKETGSSHFLEGEKELAEILSWGKQGTSISSIGNARYILYNKYKDYGSLVETTGEKLKILLPTIVGLAVGVGLDKIFNYSLCGESGLVGATVGCVYGSFLAEVTGMQKKIDARNIHSLECGTCLKELADYRKESSNAVSIIEKTPAYLRNEARTFEGAGKYCFNHLPEEQKDSE